MDEIGWKQPDLGRWQPPHCLDELEHAVHLVKTAHKSIQTQSDLDRVYRSIQTLNYVWATRTREMEKAG